MVLGHSKRTNLDELHSGAIRDSTKLVSYNFQMDGDGVGRLNLSNINDTTNEFVRYLVNSNVLIIYQESQTAFAQSPVFLSAECE